MKTDVKERLIWFKGEIINVNNAKINILSPTSQFGLNVFEGIPCYWNDEQKQLYGFRLEKHYARLLRSVKLLQIKCPYTVEEMKQAFISIIRANGYKEDISVRQTIFVDGFGSWSSDEPSDMFIAPIPRGNIKTEYNKNGLNTCITSWRRISDNTLSPRIKCGANYINSRSGQKEALQNGYDTCILLNEEGKVAEGPGSCLFIVCNGKLITPKLTDSVLESITRDTVIKIARDLKIETEERSVDRTEIYTCDEAFLCGSAMEITPVYSIDKYSIGNGKTGQVTENLRIIYLDAARGKIKKFNEWITPIY